MSRSEANLIPAEVSVAIEDVYNSNDEMTDTNGEILIPDKINISNDDTFKKSMQKKLEEVIREKKENFYEFKNSGDKNSDPNATSNNSRDTREIQGKHPDGSTVIIGDSILNGFIQERLSRKGRAIKLYNFRGATVDDIVVIRTERCLETRAEPAVYCVYVENRLILELSTLLGARNVNKY